MSYCGSFEIEFGGARPRPTILAAARNEPPSSRRVIGLNRMMYCYAFRIYFIPIEIIVCIVLHGGLLTCNSESIRTVNKYGIASICGLVGFYPNKQLKSRRKCLRISSRCQRRDWVISWTKSQKKMLIKSNLD